jgi:hypothetical protein
MPELITLLKSVPDVVWSGAIASILTLSGVFLSNRSNTVRLKIQLQHDASEKSKERTAVLRRETYLLAVEELVKINSYLANLPQVDITKINAGEGMQGFFVAAAKLQLVAESKTALLVNELSANYGDLAFTIMTQLIPIAMAKNEIAVADDQYSKVQAEVDRLLAKMAEQHESGQPNQDVSRAVNTSFEFQMAQSKQYANDRDAAWGRFNALNLAFQRSLLHELREIGGKQIPVMVEIRRDLGLTGDLSKIEELMNQQWTKIESRLDALIESLKDGFRSSEPPAGNC